MLLEARGISKRFGALQVLDDVSLSVDSGELVVLVGDNGAGKSTLAKCIAGAVRLDGGEVLVAGEPLGNGQDDAHRAGIGVVWQDLSLCDNLDAVANLFLGRERRRLLLSSAEMMSEAQALVAELGINIPDVTRPVASLSGGQRQAIAVARAFASNPAMLILDEPTASLGRSESQMVFRLVRELRAKGRAVLLISHQLEHVFDMADRIVVLRQGRVVAQVSPLEVHPDDIVALQSGLEIDSSARRQLRRLGSLVEQLSDVEPAASLPLVVSAMTAAIGQEHLCVHLLDGDDGDHGKLRRSAAVGLSDGLHEALAELPLGHAGGPFGVAAADAMTVITEDVHDDDLWHDLRVTADDAGVRSAWATPIVGSNGVLGTIAGFGETVGRPRGDQLELITLYARHAASSIERGRLFTESRQRNRVLEAIRMVLEVLAGPQQLQRGLDAALIALCDVLGAEAAAIRVADDGGAVTRASAGEAANDELLGLADDVLATGRERSTDAKPGLLMAVPFIAPTAPAALAVRWPRWAAEADGFEVLHDVARSMCLALEREQLEASQREAQALRHSQRMQRDFLSRLNHELRTPLTAIHGCVDTLRQPDVSWAEEAEQRFLDTIAAESERMRRLVADLLDVSAIDAGIFRVHPDWCELRLVLEASVACVASGSKERISLDVADALAPVWADHDRLEQVFVNLIENAMRHTPPSTRVHVSARAVPHHKTVEIRVTDDGPGISVERAESLLSPKGDKRGLGLPIAQGIARAHGGDLYLESQTVGTSFVVSLPLAPETADEPA